MILIQWLVFFSQISLAQVDDLYFVRTDSPRQTLETFYSAMNTYKEGLLENNPQKIMRIQDAIRCFGENSRVVISSQREKELAAVFLKEFLDRVVKLDFSQIPEDLDAPRWRLPRTEIVLRPETEGDRQGEWLISEATWRNAQQFYERVRHRPYLKGTGEGALYVQPWMESYLPSWSKKETLGLKNWQWIGLVVGLSLGLLLRLITYTLLMIYRGLNLPAQLGWQRSLINQLEKPIALLAASSFWFAWINYLKLEGIPYSIVSGLIQIVFGLALTWVAYRCANVFANRLKELAAVTESPLDDQLVPFIEKTIKVSIILLGILLILQNMGVNVMSLLAGLGLGGLAFALAAKDTAANLFGSIMILIDRPFNVGDLVKVGDIEGTVEEVGFRSTRIRTLYNSLVTIPNANMAVTQIDNLGARLYRRTSTHLDLVYGTPKQKVESFIAGLRQIILDSDKTRKDLFHIYFTEYGSSSLRIMFYYFIIAAEWGEELEERHRINLQIMDLAEKVGVEFAFPTQTIFLENSSPDAPGPSRA